MRPTVRLEYRPVQPGVDVVKNFDTFQRGLVGIDIACRQAPHPFEWRECLQLFSNMPKSGYFDSRMTIG